MERGVENRDLRHAGQHLVDGVDAFEAGGVVQRCDLAERADLGLGVFVDQAALREKLAAVGHAVAYGLDFAERFDDSVFGIGQRLHHQLDAGGVVRNGAVQLERRFAHGLVREVAFRQTDALDETFREQFAGCGLHVDDLILDRRGAAVENQNDHCRYENLVK